MTVKDETPEEKKNELLIILYFRNISSKSQLS